MNLFLCVRAQPEYINVINFTKVLEIPISYFSEFMIWLNNFMAALKTKVRREASKNTNVKYKEIVIGKPSMLTYASERISVPYNKKFKKVLKEIKKKYNLKNDLIVVSADTKCEASEDDRLFWTNFNVVPMSSTVVVEV